MNRIAVLSCSFIAFMGAAEAGQVRQTLEDVNACSAIKDSGQRLACYDAAAAKVRSSLNEATEEDQMSLFGLDLFSGSSLGSSGEATKPEDFGRRDLPAVETQESGGVITQITVTLTDVARNNAGHEVYVLENGQVWRQKESADIGLPRNVTGLKVKIRQGSLGSYYLSREGANKSVAVERVK
jgi:hypothetical protein